MQMSIHIADLNLTACYCERRSGVPGENGPEDGRNILVTSVDGLTGRFHSEWMTEVEASTVFSVALSGEDYPLPAEMCERARELVQRFPAECNPIP